MTTSSAEHTSRAKDPAIVQEAQKPIGRIKGLFSWLAVGLVVFATFSGIRSCWEEAKTKAEAEAKATATAPATPPVVVEYPISGEGHATQDTPMKAYLDPKRTFTRPSGPARYIFVEDKSLYWDDLAGHRASTPAQQKEWEEMPAGRYDVYPLVAEDIFFRWYQ